MLARDRVRYVGEPVAVLVAEDDYLAHDAAELVQLDLDELPVVLDPVAALAEDAPSLWDGRDNEAVVLESASATSRRPSRPPTTSSAPSSRSAGTPACRSRRAAWSPSGTRAAST